MLIELFPPNEVVRIKQMIPGDISDYYTWAFSNHGAYTVKTGFNVLVKAKSKPVNMIPPREQAQISLKKRVWKIPTLPKIRMFLWRVISGAVAVAERLNSRGLNVETRCKLCNGGSESINHVLFQCSMATQIWRDAAIVIHPDALSLQLEDNLKYIFDAMEDTRIAQVSRRKIPWVLWLIWKNRNSIIYGKTQRSIGQLLSDVEDEVEQWFTVNKPTTQEQQVSNRALHCDRWLPPEPEFMKCNLHANWRNAHLHSGLAWITRDHQGNVAHHARDAITFAPNRFTAELRCVIWALQSLHDLGASKIIIASDYQEVIDAIKAPQQWPKFRSLLEEIGRLKEGFSAVIFEGEKTTANAIARDLAKSVLRDGRFQSYLALGGPSWLSERIAREHNGNDV